MNSDEQAIRALVATWLEASAVGDLNRVLELMADDVVFLGAGRPPMRGKDAFAAASRASEAKARIEAVADIQEIRIFGDWAYSWNQLTLTLHPSDRGPAKHMAGPVLSVLRKLPGGKWVIFRDANMVGPAQPAGSS